MTIIKMRARKPTALAVWSVNGGITIEEEKLTPLKAIRAKCLDCCCGSTHEVKLCPADDCPLHEYRFGKNKNLSRKLSDKQRELLSQYAFKKSDA